MMLRLYSQQLMLPARRRPFLVTGRVDVQIDAAIAIEKWRSWA